MLLMWSSISSILALACLISASTFMTWFRRFSRWSARERGEQSMTGVLKIRRRETRRDKKWGGERRRVPGVGGGGGLGPPRDLPTDPAATEGRTVFALPP